MPPTTEPPIPPTAEELAAWEGEAETATAFTRGCECSQCRLVQQVPRLIAEVKRLRAPLREIARIAATRSGDVRLDATEQEAADRLSEIGWEFWLIRRAAYRALTNAR